MIKTFWYDVQFGFRMLAKKPGISLVAILTLGLGIGATTAVFTYLDHWLLNPYIYKDWDRLVRVDSQHVERGLNRFWLSPLDFLDIQEHSDVFAGIGAYQQGVSIVIHGEQGPQRGSAVKITPNMFTVLGVEPLHGRLFLPEEDQPGRDKVVLLNYGFWQRGFGGDLDVLGETIRLDDGTYEVVGIMPPALWPGSYLWMPLSFTDEDLAEASRNRRFLNSWARLKPGVSVDEAAAQVEMIAARLAQQHPATNEGWGGQVYRPKDRHRERFKEQASFYLLPILFVLLITCANVAHLQLARAADRQREMAVRASIGAGRGRLIRQLLTENLILAAAGGVLGVLLAHGFLEAILSVQPTLDYIRGEFAAVDQRSLIFAIAMASLTGILFGLAPAWQGSRADLNQGLKETSKGATGTASAGRLRNLLLVSEISLTVMLLVGAGLMISNLSRAFDGELGFRTDNLLSLTTFLDGERVREPEKLLGAYRSTLEGLSGLPGATSVAVATPMPLFFDYGMQVRRIDSADSDSTRAGVQYRSVSPNFFQTLGIRLTKGRAFDERDDQRSTPVVIVSEALARLLFPDGNSLGRRLAPATRPGEPPPAESWEIVGVVGDVKASPLPDVVSPPAMYFPFLQQPQPFISYAIKTDGDPYALAPSARATVQTVMPDRPLEFVRSMEDQFVWRLRQQSTFPAVLVAISLLALALATVGTYALISHSVAQRTQEFGLRSALGAQRSDILALVTRQGMRLTLLGVVVGTAGSAVLMAVLRSYMSELEMRRLGMLSADVLSCAVPVLLLIAVAWLANYIPARRATKVDPMTALRYE